MIKNHLHTYLYGIVLLSALILFSISGIYLLGNPLWDVTNWYVIAFSNSIISLLIIQIPWLILRFTPLKLTHRKQIVYYVFIFLTLILGEGVGIYRMYEFYDSIIHVAGGFVLSMIGNDFYSKFTKEKSILITSLFILGFQALFGTLWELFEFGLDFWIGSNTQSYKDEISHALKVGQAALSDTMIDFMCNTLGAILFVGILVIIQKRNHELSS